jgi:predicted transglutaminase-like cysteine proteinase
MRIALAITAAFILSASCTKKDELQGNLILTGNIKGLKEGVLYIKKMQDTSLIIVDSIRIDGVSRFGSGINLESPEVFYLELDRGTSDKIDNQLRFFAEPGKIHIETSLERFYADAKITGSVNHKLLEEFETVNSRFNDQLLELTAQELSAIKDKKAVPSESLDAKEASILKKKYLYAINFAINHKDKEVAPYIALSQIQDVNLKFLDTIRNSLSPKVSQSKYGKLLTRYAEERRKAEKY